MTIYLNFVESGQYPATYIGTDVYQNIQAFNGFVAYFAIVDLVSGHSEFLRGASENCLIGYCTHCSISFKIPDLGEGCGPNSIDLTQDANGNNCDFNLPCYGDFTINCKCSTLSCVFQNSSSCACLDYSAGSLYETACDCSLFPPGQGCCLDECKTCSNEDTCLTCKDLNSSVQGIGKCKCNDGYYTEGDISINPCKKCPGECYLCESESVCISCRDDQAELNNGRCICKAGYFNVTDLDTITCFPCLSECSACTDNSTCTNCKDHYTDIINGQCICKDGYWLNDDAISEKVCTLCDTRCLKCENLEACTECVSNLYMLDNGKCSCKYGYWYNSLLTSTEACILCDPKCTKCSDDQKCTECKSNLQLQVNEMCACENGYWYNDTVQGNEICSFCDPKCAKCSNLEICDECKYGFYMFENKTCYCGDGYWFNDTILGSETCSPCESGCTKCENLQTCTKCVSEVYLLEEGICKCKDGYWYNPLVNNCKECDDDCKTCKSSDICESCKGEHQIVNQGVCVCDKGFFKNDSNICTPCDQSCETCENSDDCLNCTTSEYELVNKSKCLLKCEENMERIGVSCECIFGYKISEEKCIQDKFAMNLSISKSNKLKLSFSENLKESLEKKNILIEISESVNFNYNLTEITKKLYLISFVFKESLKNNTEFKLKLNEPIISYNGSLLENYEYSGNLFEYTFIPVYFRNLFEKSTAASKSVITFSILSSVISNPAAAWALVSTLQIIPYIPIVKSGATSNIKVFCSAMGNFNMLPNVVEYIFDSNSASGPFEEAQNIGFTSSLFFINFGKQILIFIGTLLIWPIVKLFQIINLGMLSSKIKKILKNYKYSFFIRFWIQSILDVGFYAIIQLKSVKSI